MYRGRRLISTSPQLPVVEEPQGVKEKHRIRFLCWNVGGLSDVLFTELQQWLEKPANQHIKIITLQETHWDFSGDWTTSKWHFCHSATGRKGSGGILIGIRSDLASAQDIRWSEAEPGRLLQQVRCFLEKQQMDVVGFYQFAFLQKAGMTEHIMTQRRQLTNKLDALLASLPARSQILLGGDFNTSLSRESGICGYGLLDRELSDKERQDQGRLMQVLQRHKLTALNTWGKKKTAATYVHAKGGSQIDYVCARRAVVDGIAKSTKPVDTEMAGWRTTGHKLLLGSIPHRWTPWKRSRKALKIDPGKEGDDTRLREHLSSSVPCSIMQLRDAVHLAGGVAPDRVVRPELSPVAMDIRTCWQLRRKVRVAQTLLGAGFIFVFRYFRQRLAYMKAHRALKKALRARKRQRLLDMLQQAEMAAKRHDVRGLYGVVNLLCPNKHRQRIRLRDAAGQLMSGLEDCRALAEYARGLFMAPDSDPLPLLKVSTDMLRLERWQRAAQQLKAEKAAPYGTPPLRNWKQHSQVIAPLLHKTAVQALCRDDPCIPLEWTEVQLAWLAKPKKCEYAGESEDGGLMSGDTKMFMSVLKEATHGYVMAGLLEVPQFAYRQLSSTIDALLRGSQHCAMVRALTGQVNTDVATRLAIGEVPEITGGLMISRLDLAKAFDCMPFGVMYTSLREIGIPDELARLVVETHRQSTCVVRHSGTSIRISMKRGLRQGCPLAPSVFTAWTISLCRMLGSEWCREHASLFADDVHGHWIIRTCEQFQLARLSALKLIEALHRSGMKVSYDKSEAVLLLRGRAATGLKQKFVPWSKDKYVLLLGTDSCTGREVMLPVTDKLEYLGAVLSYGPMESQTVQARAAKAWSNFTKLGPVLRTSSSFSTRQKLRVFQACVVPALLYGIIGVGITAASLRLVQSTFSRMLRKILRIHEHGVSNEEVLQRAGLQPVEQLRSLLQGKARALAVDGHQSIALREPAQHRLKDIENELHRIEHLPKAGLIEIDKTGEAVICPQCGLEFHNQKSLEAHYTAKHAHVHRDARTSFDRREHTLFGLPQCRLCRQTLYDWASMERHITEGRCPRLKQAAAQGRSISDVMQQVLQDEKFRHPSPLRRS